MAKVELRGYILDVKKPETVGEKNTSKQSIILKVPAYVDEFGDKRGEDEEWLLDIMGDNVAKFNLGPEAKGKRAKCTVYLNGRRFNKQDGTVGHLINSRIGAIELIVASQQNAPANPAPSGW